MRNRRPYGANDDDEDYSDRYDRALEKTLKASGVHKDGRMIYEDDALDDELDDKDLIERH